MNFFNKLTQTNEKWGGVCKNALVRPQNFI